MPKKPAYLARMPKAMLDALEELRSKHKRYIEPKVTNGRMYVFETTTKWDKEAKKRRKISKYLGKITEKGEFVEGKIRNKPVVAIESTTPQGSTPIMSADNLRVTKNEEILLRALSMNGRASMGLLSKLTGLDRNTVYYQVKRLEKKFGIRYIAEIDTDKLGYLKFIILVKFLGEVPNSEEIKTAVQHEPKVQFAMLLNGSQYNLLMYALAEDNSDIGKVRYRLNQEGLGKYDAEWRVTPFYETYNFVPLRDDFVDLLGERVSKNSKRKMEVVSEKQNRILYREFAVLKELNKDGKTEFTEIDNRHSFDRNRAQYSYYKLKDEGLIKRITVEVQKLPIKYMGIIFMTTINSDKISKTRDTLLGDIIEEVNNHPINKYSLVGDIAEPYGTLFFAPIFSDGTLEMIRNNLSGVKGIKIETAIVTQTLFGNVCYRRFDNLYSMQYDILVRDYGTKKEQKVDYNEFKDKKLDH